MVQVRIGFKERQTGFAQVRKSGLKAFGLHSYGNGVRGRSSRGCGKREVITGSSMRYITI